MVTLYSYFSIILGKIENATKFYKGFRSANQKQFEDRDRLLQKTNPYLAEEISDSNHPQRIKCNKKAKSICRIRRRNLITRKSLVSSLSKQFAPGSSSIVLITSADS
ncbi:uncharacterized protein LOC142630768 [Castanea sativa]|uniref:uncharacterized protein LOC142630768 n=1 Tax=Castanea sativa TaxID=21020 RepID=UPI003F64DD24